MPVKAKSIAERFWGKVDKNGPVPLHRPDLGPCWIWQAQINKVSGYGCFWVAKDELGRNINVPAHRVSYELSVGKIPEDLHIDHLCRVRNCVCPKHLEPVTNAENTERGDLSHNGYLNREKTHCLRGHLFDVANTKWVKAKYGTERARQCRTCNALRARMQRAKRGGANV